MERMDDVQMQQWLNEKIDKANQFCRDIGQMQFDHIEDLSDTKRINDFVTGLFIRREFFDSMNTEVFWEVDRFFNNGEVNAIQTKEFHRRYTGSDPQ